METVKNDIEASSVVCPGYLLKLRTSRQVNLPFNGTLVIKHKAMSVLLLLCFPETRFLGGDHNYTVVVARDSVSCGSHNSGSEPKKFATIMQIKNSWQKAKLEENRKTRGPALENGTAGRDRPLFETVVLINNFEGGCSLADAICSAIDLTEAIASSTCSETLLEVMKSANVKIFTSGQSGSNSCIQLNSLLLLQKLHPAKYGSILKTHDLTEEKGNPKNSGHLRICPSYNLKQIQSLNGKITALSRFLSRPAEN
ncbi:hypothetical protein Tco_0489660 [Tanacetum coccineum]